MDQPDEAALPISQVTLYTSGVGYFERGGEVEGTARLTLLFPIGQVNDVLKSLVLLDAGDGAAAIQPVTYAAQDPASRALQAFSVDISGNPDRAELLNQIRGTSVTVGTGEGEALTGVIVGVEQQNTFRGDEMTAQFTLNLLAEDGLHSVPLSDVRRIKINDAKLNEELRQALAAVAQGRDASKRPLTLTFSGQGRRRVLVGYIAEAPAWQTTYRLVLGDAPLLQGWALVQNTGQDDWNDAQLSLVSGRPISFIQDLYTPLYVHRPRVQTRIPAAPSPQTYDSNILAEPVMEMDMMELRSPDYAPAAAMAPAPAGGARRKSAGGGTLTSAMATDAMARQNVATSGAELGGSLFAYHIDVPVSIPRQQSAMIPFTASEVQAERVSVYNAQVQKGNPLSGVRLKNTTALHLMGGPLTVFDEGGGGHGYVGDALMDDTEPGQTRLLTFAVDLAVDGEARTEKQTNVVSSLTIVQGTLRLRNTYRQTTEYTFKNNASAPRTLIVEHPNSHWQLVEPANPSERTVQWHRFDVTVPAGASVNFTVREEQMGGQDFSLLTHDVDQILSYRSSGEISEPVRAALAEAVARRRRLAAIDQEIDDVDDRQETITTEQARIRQNMQNLEYKSDLYKRYVAELNAQETQIKDLQARREALRAEQAAAQTALNDYLAGLDFS